MLSNSIAHFLTYCKTAGFSKKSLETYTFRLGEFNDFVTQKQIDSIPQIKYSHLLELVADYKTPRTCQKATHLGASSVLSLP